MLLMNKINNKILYIFAFLIGTLSVQLVYLSANLSMTTGELEKKRAFVEIIALPDLAIGSDYYIRHRTLATLFDINKDDALLRENSFLTFSLDKAQ